MTNYKVEVRGADWRLRKKESASLLISVGQEYCEGAKLQATVDWVNKNFSNCFIDIADTLQRHNLIALQDMSEFDADHASKIAGQEWIERNIKFIEALAVPYAIRRWDEWRLHPNFDSTLKNVHNLYAIDTSFKEALDLDVQGFIARRQMDGSLQDENTIVKMEKSSGLFILEEIAASILMGNACPASVIYNAKELLAYNYVRKGQACAPAGLEKLDYIRITFRARSSAYCVPIEQAA